MISAEKFDRDFADVDIIGFGKKSPGKPVADNKTPVVAELDTPDKIERALAKAREWPKSVEGEHSDDNVYRLACDIKDEGISEEKCAEIIYDEHDHDGFDLEWIAYKVASAYRNGQEPPGSKTAEADFADEPLPPLSGEGVEALQPVKYAGPLSIVDVIEGDHKPPEQVVEGLIVEGVPLSAYGDGGIGKTTIFSHMGLCIAAGKPFHGRKTKQKPVLLVLGEDDYGITGIRLKAAAEYEKIDYKQIDLRVYCTNGDDISLAKISDLGTVQTLPFFKELELRLAEKPGSFVVLDSMADIAQLPEKDRQPVNALFKKVLRTLCKKHSATILVLAHPSKQSMADGSWYSGSTAFKNAVRGTLVVKRGSGGQRILSTLKNNYGPDDDKASIKLAFRGGVFVPPTHDAIKAAEQNKYQIVLEEILEAIDKKIAVAAHNQAKTGLKPNSLAMLVNKKHGDSTITPAEVFEIMVIAQQQGDLVYVNGRGSRKATFVRPAPVEDFANDQIDDGI